MQIHGYSERKACQLVGANRASIRYESNKPDEGLLKERITSIAHQKRRYGYRRIHLILKCEGVNINHKKLFRIYKELGIKVLKRGGRKRAIGTRVVAMALTKKNQERSLDFVHDVLANGRRLRMMMFSFRDYCDAELIKYFHQCTAFLGELGYKKIAFDGNVTQNRINKAHWFYFHPKKHSHFRQPQE